MAKFKQTAIAYQHEEGHVVVRASALGKCVRALWASLEGIDPVDTPEYLSRAAEEGNLHEEHIRTKLAHDHGRKIYGDQTELKLWIIPRKLVVIGHTDGFMEPKRFVESHNDIPSGLPDLIEIKTMSRAVFDKWMAKGWDSNPSYAWQISAYMLAARWPEGIKGTVYAAKRRDDGLIDERYLTEPPISLKEIRAKMIALYKHWKLGEMPPCDIPESNRWGCPVFFLHDEDVVPEEQQVDAPDLDTLAAEYLELGKTATYATKRKKEIKEEMEAFRDGRPEFSTENFNFKVTFVPRDSLDKAAVMVEHGDDFFERYTHHGGYERWYVKERKG